MAYCYKNLLKELTDFRKDPQIHRSYHLICLSSTNRPKHIDTDYIDFQLTDTCKVPLITPSCFKHALSINTNNYYKEYKFEILQAFSYYINSLVMLLYTIEICDCGDCYYLFEDITSKYFDPILQSETALVWLKNNNYDGERGDISLGALWKYILSDSNKDRASMARDIYDGNYFLDIVTDPVTNASDTSQKDIDSELKSIHTIYEPLQCEPNSSRLDDISSIPPLVSGFSEDYNRMVFGIGDYTK